MGKSRTVISGISWTIIQNLTNILYGIVSVPFLINYFGNEEYGLIGIATSVNVYVQLLDLGMTNSVVKFLSESLEKKESDKTQKLFSFTFSFYTILGLLNTIILIILSLFTDKLFNVTPDQALTLRNLLLVLSANATFSWISVCVDQILYADELISWSRKRMTFLKLFQFVILLATLYMKLSIEAYFFCYVFLATLIMPVSIHKIKKVLPYLKFAYKIDVETVKLILPYIFGIFSFSIFQFVASSTRPVVLGNIIGPSAVTEYTIISTIASVVVMITGTFTQVLIPVITKMKTSGNEEGITIVINKGTEYANYLISLIVFLIIVSVSDILSLYVGKNFIHLSTWCTIWLCMLLLSHRNVLTSMVYAQSRLRSITIMGAFAMLVALISYYFLVPKFGVGGVIIGYLFHDVIHTLFYYSYFYPKILNRNLKFLFSRRIMPTWFCAAILCLAIHYLVIFENNYINIIVKSLLFVIFYIFSILYLINRKEDRTFMYAFVLNSIKR